MAEAPNGEKQIGRAYGAPRQPSTLPTYTSRHRLLHAQQTIDVETFSGIVKDIEILGALESIF